MSKQQNTALVKKFFEELFGKNNLSVIDESVSPDVRLFDPAAPNFKGGLQGFKEREKTFKTAFPNRNIKIDEIFGTDDGKVVVRWTGQGTQKGDLPNLPASGKNFSKLSGIVIYTIKNDKITEIHQNWDRLGLLEQLGAIEQRSLALHG